MEEISRQNFSYRINEARTDELGDLCQSFDYMINALAEKELMGKMVSESARKRTMALETGAHYEMSSKKKCGIILIGIPGFTSWLSATSVQELFSDLRTQIAELGKIILRNGGDIDKIIGDKLLVVFPFEDKETNFVNGFERTIEEILKAENQGVFPFPVALGANFGTVISGFLGVGEKRDFTIIGDAVNVAARVEAEAEKLRFNRCLISESAIRLFKNPNQNRLFSEVELKGKHSKVKLYQP
jgi:adenylate cyclase